jgi:hypothetical protein
MITEIRIDPLFRCPCGRILKAYDFDVTDTWIRLDCSHCYRRLPYTFSTSSWGGRNAVSDLGDQIARMRSVHADAVPLVELRAAEMPTKFGKKSKPVFKVVGWKTADQESVPAGRQITAQQAKREVDEAEMSDEIPF